MIGIKKMFKKIQKYFYDNSYTLPYLAVITGQKCSLHCKNCCNFSPYHSAKLDFYEASKILNDLKNILKRVKGIKLIQLQGGDFFLHRDATKILEFISKSNKIKKCKIATNCIIFPSKEQIDILKNKKFYIRISSYGLTNEIKKDELIELLNTNNINYKLHSFANGNNTWSYLGGLEMKKQSESETNKNYMKCEFKDCLTLENGLISRCARATVAHKIQKFRPKKSDFINVRNPFFSVSSLKKYWNAQNYENGKVTACYFCNGTSGKSIIAGEQLSKEEYKHIRRSNDR